jgi:hypothetical protein
MEVVRGCVRMRGCGNSKNLSALGRSDSCLGQSHASLFTFEGEILRQDIALHAAAPCVSRKVSRLRRETIVGNIQFAGPEWSHSA